MNKKTYLFALCLGLALLMAAGPVRAAVSFGMAEADGQPVLEVDAGNQRTAAFWQGDSLWLVVDQQEPLSFSLPSAWRNAFGIIGQEVLKVPGGAGLRLQVRDKSKFAYRITNAAEQTQTPAQSGPISVLALKDEVRVSGVEGKLLRAHSLAQNKTLLVLPGAKLTALDDGQLGHLKALPGDHGQAFAPTSGTGELPLLTAEQGEAVLAQDKPATNLPVSDAASADTSTEPPKLSGVATPLVAMEDDGTAVANGLAVPELPGPQARAGRQPQPEQSVASGQVDTASAGQATDAADAKSLAEEAAATPVSEPVMTRPSARFEDAMDEVNRAIARIRGLTDTSAAAPSASMAPGPDAPQPPQAQPKTQQTVSQSATQSSPVEPLETPATDTATAADTPAAEKPAPAPQALNASIFAVELADDPSATYTAAPATPTPTPDDDLLPDGGRDLTAAASPQSATAPDLLNLPDGLPQDAEIPDNAPVALAEPLLPRFGETLNDYYEFQRRLTRDFVEARSVRERDEARLRLAKLSMAFRRAPEAEGILKHMPGTMVTGYPDDPHARILYAAALVTRNQADEAVPLLQMDGGPETDRKLWLAAAYEATDQPAKALPLFKSTIDASLAYPLHLQADLRLAYARTLLAMNKPDELRDEMDIFASLMPGNKLPDEALLIMGRANVLAGNDGLAESLLAQASQSDTPAVAFPAQYEFLRYLMRRNDIGRDQAIDHLEQLRFLWRGGRMEADILYKLGQMYLEDRDYRRGLDRLKYYTIYFTDVPQEKDVAGIMTEEFMRAFTEGGKTMDALAVLGLYYDYRELTPPGAEGDALIADIAKRLRNIGLYERAISLLEHQLRFRTKDQPARARVGHDLATLHLLNRNYEAGLSVLENTAEGGSIPEKLQDDRTFLTARLHAKRRNFDAARLALANDNSPRAADLMADIAWQMENDEGVRTSLEDLYLGKSKLETWEEDDRINALRLAMAYNKTGRRHDLRALVAAHPDRFAGTDMAPVANILLADVMMPTAKRAGEQPAETALIDGLKTYIDFADTYRDVLHQRDEEKLQRLLFNRRMRQLSPPSRY